MEKDKLEFIAVSMLSLVPMLKKKVIKPCCSEECRGLTHTHIQILVMLEEIGTLPVSDIGRRMSISKPNMTPLIDRLISENMVERLPHPSDRRVINIALTTEGKEFLKIQKHKIVRSLKDNLSSLPEEDIELLHDSLENVIKIMSKVSDKE